MYQIEFTDDARKDLLRLQRKSPQAIKKLKSLLGYETSKRTRSRGEAFRIALAAIDAGIIETAKKKEKAPELAKYVLSFWDYDNSEYIRMKNLVKPNSVGPDYANNMVGTFKK